MQSILGGCHQGSIAVAMSSLFLIPFFGWSSFIWVQLGVMGWRGCGLGHDGGGWWSRGQWGRRQRSHQRIFHQPFSHPALSQISPYALPSNHLPPSSLPPNSLPPNSHPTLPHWEEVSRPCRFSRPELPMAAGKQRSHLPNSNRKIH